MPRCQSEVNLGNIDAFLSKCARDNHTEQSLDREVSGDNANNVEHACFSSLSLQFNNLLRSFVSYRDHLS